MRKELLPRLHEFEEKEEFPLEIYKKFAATGLHVLNLPEAYGGIDSPEALAIVAQELGRVDPGFALSVLASSQLFGFNVAKLGTTEQKDRYLKPLAEQGKLGCWALTEPDIGSDAVGIKTTAVKKGNSYVLNGSKTFITNAPIADFFIVLARESGTGFEGGTAFILDRNQKGMELSTPLKKMGHLTSPTGQIFLKDCEVPESQILGKAGKAFHDMKYSLDVERLVFSGIGIGIMKECLDRAVRYSLERKQFGQAIAQFQLVQEKIADMAAKTGLIEAYSEKAFQKLNAKESVNYEAAILKYMGAEMSVDVASQAIQVLGGNGYMREYWVEKLFRDARLFPIGGGTTVINKLIIAKEAIKQRMG